MESINSASYRVVINTVTIFRLVDDFYYFVLYFYLPYILSSCNYYLCILSTHFSFRSKYFLDFLGVIRLELQVA